jgi:hypothetical protein
MNFERWPRDPTGLLVDLERGVTNPELDAAFGDEDRAIGLIPVGELLHGVHRAPVHSARAASRSSNTSSGACERSSRPD